jgi:hypothetical protein
MKKLIILLSLLLFFLSTQGFADSKEIDITIGNTAMRSITPKGFYKTSEVSPMFFNFHSEFSTTPRMRLLAYLISKDDYFLLKNKTDPELHTHMSLKTLKEFEHKTLSQEWFDRVRNLGVSDINKSFSVGNNRNKELLSQLKTKVESRFDIEGEFEFEVGKQIPLRVYINQPNAFGITSIGSAKTNLYGEKSSRLKVYTTTLNLINGKLIYSYVFSPLKTSEDVAWVEEKSKEWVALLNNSSINSPQLDAQPNKPIGSQAVDNSHDVTAQMLKVKQELAQLVVNEQNPYIDFFKAQDEKNLKILKQNLSLASMSNAKQQAAINKLSKETGLAPELIRKNMELEKRNAYFETMDPRELQSLVASSPILAEQLRNPAFAALAYDEKKPLGKWWELFYYYWPAFLFVFGYFVYIKLINKKE